MADLKHPRLFIRSYLSFEECKELEFIHKSSSTVGYRPNVFSTTISHLIATNSSHLIMPLIPIRERLKDKLEEFFGCEYELFVEFTGLISWCKGASIGWHSDNNRPYLRQRDFAAVCYLNSCGRDFNGGFFHFQDGEPTTVMPMAGDVLMYTADNRNIHSVDEITDGERLTLTLWFSRDASHDEDVKLISLFSNNLLHSSVPDSCIPLPASNNMYWFSQDQASDELLGFNICWARLHVLGGTELLDHEFVNILHALQVVHFYCWKASALQSFKVRVGTSKIVELSKSQAEKVSDLKSLLLKDTELAETIFYSLTCRENELHCFDWTNFVAAIAAWEDYAWKLRKEIRSSLAYWRAHQSLYNVQSDKRL
ncbi:2-oxoglutarate (2OG) and Fe(II)-dependent oxygenase superfamily protein [Quillaja saponaria]|uniref:procollagen-proline 3-dioxygenase n=1 Tax=Quillaja saponaria TaxID=32244 RepID=A0AAD7KQ32_QUISA|nr:2-oxoglutarate (2OG) and Fe(II)-dependent oxygenase superfamily protein [Quillaja saponaria]